MTNKILIDEAVVKQALEALRENSLLVNGDDKSGGLVWCMDGYYADCFDIEAVNKQTDEAITALNRAIADAALDKIAENARELGLSYEQPDHIRDATKMVEQPAPAQEPVAWQWLDTANFRKKIPQYAERDAWRPLYTTPPAPAQRPLTDEAFYRLVRIMGTFDLATGHADSWDELLDSLESELRDVLGHLRTRREWVGLTDEEVNNYVQAVWPRNATPVAYTRTIEAKLKEKNTFTPVTANKD